MKRRRPGSAERPAPREGGARPLQRGEVLFDHAEAIVIGGGATGVGILWDLTLRGLDVVLLEQAGLASGTSGSFHGLLHSGGRYAGTDPETAAECLAENRILRSVASDFVDETGGLFVRLEEDEGADATWEERWLDGCRRAGLHPRPVRRDEALRQVPLLAPSVLRAYRVPDAAVDGFGLLWSIVWASAMAGARVYSRARVSGFLTDEAGVRGVEVVGLGGTEDEASAVTECRGGPGPRNGPGEVTAPIVINATGPWARDTAALAGAGVEASVLIARDKGVMLVFNERIGTTVVNRLRPPGDGDILVPHGPVTILGTTSSKTASRARPGVSPAEAALLMGEGRRLVPSLDRVAPLRGYAGTRPLLVSSSGGRGEGRGFLLVDHAADGTAPGLVSVAGGKFTTFRAMAAETGDLVMRRLGRSARCRTDQVGIRRRPGPARLGAAGATAAGRETAPSSGGPFACECEMVDMRRLATLLESGLGLSDLRRLCRVGMGGCQGVFCAQRLGGALAASGWTVGSGRALSRHGPVADELEAFRRGRMAGVGAVEWGSQARLAALGEALDRLTLGAGEGTRP